MPLTSRKIDLLRPRLKAKSKQDRAFNPSPNNYQNGEAFDCRMTEDRTRNYLSSNFFSPPASRKNMYSKISCRNLLKKAREVDINDPTQSYLPTPRRNTPESRMKSPGNKLRGSKNTDSELVPLEYPRIPKKSILKTI